jgi:hypothetical protein
VPCPKHKKLEVSHGKLGDLVSWSVPSRLPDGRAEILDDVISEVSEYIQGCLVIIEGFRCSLAEKKDLLEHVNGGLANPSLKGSSFLLLVIFIIIFVFVFILDGLFVRVNTPVMPSLSTSFNGFKLSTRYQPFLQGLRAHSEGISSPSRGQLQWPSNCRGSSPVRLDDVSCQAVVRRSSRVYGLWSMPAIVRQSSQRGSGKLN